MTVAKGLGGGLPVGACVTNADTADVLGPGDHGSTFAGGPVIAAAANAVLDVVTGDRFLDTVRERGDQLAAGLRDLGLEPRGLGLMVGFDLPDAQDVARRACSSSVSWSTRPDRRRFACFPHSRSAITKSGKPCYEWGHASPPDGRGRFPLLPARRGSSRLRQSHGLGHRVADDGPGEPELQARREELQVEVPR